MTAFVKEMHRKGWTAREVAKRWGITPMRISQIGRSPSQRDWDAVAGLPDRHKGFEK